MNNIKLAENVYYVGAVDWNLRDFHGYHTPRGVTYNSYLIVDEKVCLVDTVKAPYAGELIDRIALIIDPAKIDYVIINHVEPDHSSSLPLIMEKAPNAKVILTEHGKAEVLKYYQQEYNFQVVKEGDSLNIGCNTLHFIPVPMLHWPDSMATYLEEEQILFSNDAFGQHICTTQRFDDENNLNDLLYEAEKYYANILMPYSRLVAKVLEKVGMYQLKQIAPSHGVIWRSHIDKIIAKYQQWGAGYTTDKVLILYDTMWGSTEKMARRMLDGVAAAGIEGKLYRMSVSDRSEVMRDMLEAKGVLIGSPTLNNGVLPTIGALLVYLKGLRPANKTGAAFGAYGWGGGSQRDIEEMLKAAGIKVDTGLALKWAPAADEMDKCFQLGFDFATKLKN